MVLCPLLQTSMPQKIIFLLLVLWEFEYCGQQRSTKDHAKEKLNMQRLQL